MKRLEKCWPAAALTSFLSATSLAAESPASEVRFRLHQQDLIVVEGSIGGAGKLRFLIDTGTMLTVLDRNVAKTLGLAAAEGAIRLVTLNQTEHVTQVIVPELRFGPVQVKTVRAVATDLSSLSSVAGTRIDAIVGLDVLRLTSFSIDYETRRMTFGPLADSARAVPFHTTSPLLTVMVQVEDQAMRLMVDTGAGTLVLFEDRRHRKPATRRWRFRRIQSAAAASFVREVDLGGVRLGDTEWSERLALLMEAPAFPYDNLDGILAASPLGLKRLGFDFQRNRLSWEK